MVVSPKKNKHDLELYVIRVSVTLLSRDILWDKGDRH